MSVVAVANLVPILGPLAFGWGTTELLAVYWLEAGAALVLGFAKTAPARLVTLPLPDSRREPWVRIRRGSIDVGGVPVYVRNGPLLVGLTVVLTAWLAAGALAFFRSASPFAYSIAAATLPTVTGAAVLLACSHLATTRAYFGERRYRATPAMEAVGPPLAYALGTVTLFVTLADLGDHPANVAWLAAYPVAVVAGKTILEVLTRCRNRARFERIDADADPFSFDRSVRQRLSPKRSAAALPSVSRPDGRPETTVRPTRTGILVSTSFVGMDDYHAGSFFGLFLALAGMVVVLGSPVPHAFALAGVAFAGFTLSGLAIAVPRHATLEYAFHDDRLVCRDRWLERAQWDLPYEVVEAVEVHHSRLSRLAGYGTVRVETSDDEPARLAYLREPEAVAERLEHAAPVEAR